MREGMPDKLIYLDNAATTFPKPASILNRMIETYSRVGVSPGRGSYDLAYEAQELVSETRQKWLGSRGPDRTCNLHGNATIALNTALQGLLHPGDHV